MDSWCGQYEIFQYPTLTTYIFIWRPKATYMYPRKKSWLHIAIQNFTLHHFIWFLSYDMKKVGLCVLATYAMPWFFISGCWSRLRYADGKNVGPQSPSRIGDSLHHRAVTTAQKCFLQDIVQWKSCDCTTKSVLYGVNRGGINSKADDFLFQDADHVFDIQ